MSDKQKVTIEAQLSEHSYEVTSDAPLFAGETYALETLEEGNHPEDFCSECGRPNISWRANDELWNDATDPERELILCPVCFVRRIAPEVTWLVIPRRVF